MASRALFAIFLAAIVAGIPAAAYAQEGGMRSALSGDSLDVLIEPTWGEDSNTTFRVTFLQPGTDTVQVHIDYDFVIMQDGQEVFSAVPPGQPLLHTAEGIVNIPYRFQSNDEYTIEVSVAGINFIPMNTETATFGITVTPEFPAAAVGGIVAALMTTTIVLARYRRLF